MIVTKQINYKCQMLCRFFYIHDPSSTIRLQNFYYFVLRLLEWHAHSVSNWCMRSDAANAKVLSSGYDVRIAWHCRWRIQKTRLPAEGLSSNIKQLEFGILTEVWSSLLERFRGTSWALQNSRLDLDDAIPMLVHRRISSSLNEVSLMNMKGVDKWNRELMAIS